MSCSNLIACLGECYWGAHGMRAPCRVPLGYALLGACAPRYMVHARYRDRTRATQPGCARLVRAHV